VRLEVHTSWLAFTGIDGTRVVEPGDLEVLVGASSEDIRGRATVRLVAGATEV
jgi:hypothetical protein